MRLIMLGWGLIILSVVVIMNTDKRFSLKFDPMAECYSQSLPCKDLSNEPESY